MKLGAVIPDPSPLDAYTETWPITLVDQNGVGHAKTLAISITTTIFEDQALTDTNQIDFALSITAQIFDQNFNEQAWDGYDVFVACPKKTGHLTQTSSQDPNAENQYSHSFIFGGVTYGITILTFINAATFMGGHGLQSQCKVSVGVTQGAQNPVIYGIFPPEGDVETRVQFTSYIKNFEQQ